MRGAEGGICSQALARELSNEAVYLPNAIMTGLICYRAKIGHKIS